MQRLLFCAAVLLWIGHATAAESDPASTFIRQLREAEEPSERAEVVKGLSELKPLPPLIVTLVARRLGKTHDSSNEPIQAAIFSELRQVGPDARFALWAIMSGSRDDGGIHFDKSAMDALHSMFPAHQDILRSMPRTRTRWQAGMLLLGEREPALRDPLPWLVEGLQHPSADVRLDALEALAAREERAKPALDAMLKSLADEDARVRSAAMHAIGRLDRKLELTYDGRPGYWPLQPKWLYQAPPEAEPALLRALEDPDFSVRLRAAQILVRSGPAPMGASLPILIQGLRSDERGYRSGATGALSNLGHRTPEELRILRAAVPALREVMRAKSDHWQDSWIRTAAADAIVSIATPEEGVPILLECYADGPVWRPRLLQLLPQYAADERVVPFLVDAVHNQDPDEGKRGDIAEHAIRSLGKCRPVRDSAVATLQEAVRGDDLDLRGWAIGALEEIGKSDARVLPALVEAAQLPDRDGQHRAQAFEVIGRLGPDEATVTALLPLLRHRDAVVRKSAAETLGQARITAKPAVPALISRLRDGNADVREAATFALGEIGPAAAPAIPALMSAMRRHRGYWHGSPAEALFKIGPAGVPQLVRALRHDRGRSQFGPDSVLRKLGPQAAAAVPELAAMASEHDEARRNKALYLLMAIGPEARSAVPELAKLRQDPAQKQLVDWVLVKIGGEAVDVFLLDLNPAETKRCLDALASLEAMGKQGEKANPTLRLLLKSEDTSLRYGAAKALAVTDQPDEDLLNVVQEMLNDESPQVRQAGGQTLGKLGIADPTNRVLTMLLSAATQGDESIRSGIARSLVWTGRVTNKELLPTLAALLEDERTTGFEHELAESVIAILDDQSP